MVATGAADFEGYLLHPWTDGPAVRLRVTTLGGSALLCGSLAVAFWLPRRRVSIRSRANDLALTLRGGRFDRPSDELGRLLDRLRAGA